MSMAWIRAVVNEKTARHYGDGRQGKAPEGNAPTATVRRKGHASRLDASHDTGSMHVNMMVAADDNQIVLRFVAKPLVCQMMHIQLVCVTASPMRWMNKFTLIPSASKC